MAGAGGKCVRRKFAEMPSLTSDLPKTFAALQQMGRILTSSSNHPIISTDMVADLLALLSPRQVEELEQAVSALFDHGSFDHGSNKACLEDGEEVDGGRTAE